jgi:hypothetical protein
MTSIPINKKTSDGGSSLSLLVYGGMNTMYCTGDLWMLNENESRFKQKAATVLIGQSDLETQLLNSEGLTVFAL